MAAKQHSCMQNSLKINLRDHSQSAADAARLHSCRRTSSRGTGANRPDFFRGESMQCDGLEVLKVPTPALASYKGRSVACW